MKIALLGAPGTGKTKLARRLARILNADFKTWVVIDGYVDRLKKSTGETYGPQIPLRPHLQVIGERWQLEDAAQHKNFHTITCGGIYESMIYAAAQGMQLPFISNEQQLQEENHIARSSADFLGILEVRNFDYDALFYLPLDWDGETHSDLPNPWDGVIDAKLPEILEGFNRYAVELTGTILEQTDHAIQIIQAISKASTAAPDQSAV